MGSCTMVVKACSIKKLIKLLHAGNVESAIAAKKKFYRENAALWTTGNNVRWSPAFHRRPDQRSFQIECSDRFVCKIRPFFAAAKRQCSLSRNICAILTTASRVRAAVRAGQLSLCSKADHPLGRPYCSIMSVPAPAITPA